MTQSQFERALLGDALFAIFVFVLLAVIFG